MGAETAKKRTVEVLKDVTPAPALPAWKYKRRLLALQVQRELWRAKLYLGLSWLLVSAAFSLAWCCAAITYMEPQALADAGLLGSYAPGSIHETATHIATWLAPLAVIANMCAASSIRSGLVGSFVEIVASAVIAIVGTMLAFIAGAIAYTTTGTLVLAVGMSVFIVGAEIFYKLVIVAETIVEQNAPSHATTLAHSRFADRAHSRISDTEI